jgi:hypothetical protein
MVIWCAGDIRLRSLRTPAEFLVFIIDFRRIVFTLKHHSICNNFLDIILSLREQVEDVHNAPLNKLWNLALFVEDSAQD